MTSIQDVVWAIVARCDPERSVEIIKDTKGSRIDMAIAPDQRELNANSRMIIDATTPFTWKHHPLAGDIISTPERTHKIHGEMGMDFEVVTVARLLSFRPHRESSYVSSIQQERAKVTFRLRPPLHLPVAGDDTEGKDALSLAIDKRKLTWRLGNRSAWWTRSSG